ncbi:MAG: cytochrome-c oxidase, cbb3-type subunit III [Magnetococcales bacterium]|nr:cytochrome-c oxidase, cbb3-type subunit III [Magnetococcales bacterium]
MAEEEKNVETTGHQWDDDEGYPLKEYNNPLPSWWLYTFYATIVWSVIYWFLYPAWPLANDFTKGMLGWSQYKQLDEEMAAAKALQKPFDEKLAALSTAEIASDPKLLAYAISGGKATFGDNCAPCHGSGGIGAKVDGFPSLVDDDWLYGGTLEAIEETIQYGRAGNMPAHLDAADGAFSQAQVSDLTQYVLGLSGRAQDKDAAGRGEELYKGDAACYACHGDNGKGSLIDTADGEPLDPSMGAPNLSDGLWLYGGAPERIMETISYGRIGKMPAWGEGFEGFGRQLDPLTIKEVTLYVHSLGGGY